MSYTREMFENARNEIENRRVSSEDKAEKRRRDPNTPFCAIQ